MHNKYRLAIRMILIVIIPVIITLAVAASSLAQVLPRTQALDGLSKIFLPFVAKDSSGLSATSFELIEQALKRGEIDQETALVYKVFAVFLDPRLPGQYKGNGSPNRDTLIMGEVAATWSSLSPATQALLEPFFLPPAAPGSWLELQQGQTAMALAPEPVEWVTLSRPKGGVKVWYQTRYPGDDALAAQILTDMEDTVWPALTNLMGRGPRGDDGLPNNGGDGLFDIYLVRIGDHGEVIEYPPGCENRPAYMLINGATNQLRGTLTHEFFHAIAWGYSFAKGCEYPEYRWLNEASATWSEDYISPWFDTGNSEHPYAIHFLNYPEWPLESLGEQHEYGAYLWPFYLARSFQPGIIRTIWDATGSKDSLAAIDGAIPGGFLEQWPVFSRLNLNQAPVDNYLQWDGLDKQASFYGSHIVELGNESELKIPIPAFVDHLAARNFHFTFSDPKVTKVRFENGDRFFSGAEPRAKVQALIKIEGQDWTLEDWTNLPERKFCRTEPAERLEELVIIFSNSEWENRLDVLDPGNPGPTLWVNDQPCSCEQFGSVQNWTGQVQFSFTTSAADGDESIAFSHSATVNLLMVPNYNTGSYVAWQDASLSGTGEVNDTHTETHYVETVVGSGALYPGGPTQDDPSASFGVSLSTCNFEFHLQTAMLAQYTKTDIIGSETFKTSTGVGFMDINDIPANQLTGSRTVPAIWYPYGDEPSWYVPGSVFDGDLEMMIGNNFGEATVSWSFVPAD